MGRRRGEGRQQTEEKDDADRDAFTYSKSVITLVYTMYRRGASVRGEGMREGKGNECTGEGGGREGGRVNLIA